MPLVFREDFSLDTKQVAILAETIATGTANDNAAVAKCKETVKEAWGWTVDGPTLKVLQEICFAVFERSAALAAVSICVFAERTRVSSPKFGCAYSCS